MTSVSTGHIILTQNQPVGSGSPERGSNSRPPDQESHALTPPPPPPHPFPINYFTHSLSHKVNNTSPKNRLLVHHTKLLKYIILHFPPDMNNFGSMLSMAQTETDSVQRMWSVLNIENCTMIHQTIKPLSITGGIVS